MSGGTLRAVRLGWWGALLLALGLVVVALTDAWRAVGRLSPGVAVMANGAVGIGGVERAGLRPFDRIVAVDGRPVATGREVWAEARRHPPGTILRYTVERGSTRLEMDVATRPVTRADFARALLDSSLPTVLLLLLGAVVLALRPDAPETRVFVGYALVIVVTTLGYVDARYTYRFTHVFLTAWSFVPAALLHLALTFPERQPVARRVPRVVGLPYALSAVAAVPNNLLFFVPGVAASVTPTVTAAYWAGALVLTALALLRTARAGATPLVRQRARVLLAGYVVGVLVPVLGTAAEGALRVTVPFLAVVAKLDFLFPVAVTYAIARYDLFDVRAVLRAGTIYSAVTGLVVLVYTGLLTLLNVALASLEVSVPPLLPATAVSLAVVLFLNPVYARTQALVDRAFFRERLDAQEAVERLADAMTTVLDPSRIAELIGGTAEALFRPTAIVLLVHDEGRGEFRPADPARRGPALPAGAPLARVLDQVRGPVTRARLLEDPALARVRVEALADLDALRAEVAVPVVFHGRVTALLALGPRRSTAAWTGDDLRWLRGIATQSAVALEHARAYAALGAALRRVEILESVRASLSKFVPRTVQALIEQAPEAPALAKRDADVSVLFVDIAGYTRLTERLDPGRVNLLVERYFGAFLDEILARGGDVNETAGDGLMVIFQDADPARHAGAAVAAALAILERARQINAQPDGGAEPIALHVGVNSGVASVGATKIEGTAGTRWTYTASGSVTNLAARLASLGDGDAVIVGPGTRQRLPADAAVEDLGEVSLRNVDEPVHAYRVVAAAGPAAPGPTLTLPGGGR